VKHVFAEHLVLQFDCTNTIAEQRLENVSVMLDLADAVSCRALWCTAGYVVAFLVSMDTSILNVFVACARWHALC
jgi:coatomer protein complex subunit gamma